MRNSPFWLIIVGLMVVLDIYVFQAVKLVSAAAGARTRTIIYGVYWAASILALLALILLPLLKLETWSQGLRSVVFATIIALFFAKVLVALFLLIDDIRRLIQWAAGKLFFNNTEGAQLQEGETISRSHFLTWAGIGLGGGVLGSLLYGFSNKYDYRVRKVPLQFSNLPASFKGMKVVQISDIHSGSLLNHEAVKKGVEKINSLKPDLVVFTGDLVNNRSDEMAGLKEIFKNLTAPMGVYSILGNHDYGDYEQWESAAHKRQNLDTLKKIHAEMGWQLLLNQNAVLERNGEQIGLLGVENWSAKARFPKYGKLADAYKGAEHLPFKILLSHDPSHWDAEVVPQYADIDLMLAGHTHGMQFGVELPWLRWSPVQYVYEQWAGLYSRGSQKLYVNRGFGFIGYPGRVGILPEITLFELA